MSYHYERSYKSGRFIASILEGISIVLVALGLIVFAFGILSLSINLGSSFGNGLSSAWYSTFSGAVLTITGAFALLSVQALRAVLDISEMTRDLLHLQTDKMSTNETIPSAVGRREPTLTSAD